MAEQKLLCRQRSRRGDTKKAVMGRIYKHVDKTNFTLTCSTRMSHQHCSIIILWKVWTLPWHQSVCFVRADQEWDVNVGRHVDGNFYNNNKLTFVIASKTLIGFIEKKSWADFVFACVCIKQGCKILSFWDNFLRVCASLPALEIQSEYRGKKMDWASRFALWVREGHS